MLTIWHFVRCFASYFYSFISFADGAALSTSVLLHSLYVSPLFVSLYESFCIGARVACCCCYCSAGVSVAASAAILKFVLFLNLKLVRTLTTRLRRDCDN